MGDFGYTYAPKLGQFNARTDSEGVEQQRVYYLRYCYSLNIFVLLFFKFWHTNIEFVPVTYFASEYFVLIFFLISLIFFLFNYVKVYS